MRPFQLCKVRVDRRGLGEHDSGEAGMAENAGAQIVEVVGDATGEQAETFEFLTLEEFSFECDALVLRIFLSGDVAGQAFE